MNPPPTTTEAVAHHAVSDGLCLSPSYLGMASSRANTAVPALVRAVAHVNSQVRANAAAALGKLHGTELVQGLLIELTWAVVLVFVCRWLYARGLRRYSAYGG